MKLILIDTVRLLCRLYEELTGLSSCALRKSGIILLAEGSCGSRLRRQLGTLSTFILILPELSFELESHDLTRQPFTGAECRLLGL